MNIVSNYTNPSFVFWCVLFLLPCDPDRQPGLRTTEPGAQVERYVEVRGSILTLFLTYFVGLL